MTADNKLYLVTVRMDAIAHWPFLMFFKAVPTLADVIPVLGSQPLPYATAIAFRDQAIALIQQHGLPAFEPRYAATEIVLCVGADRAGSVELRELSVYDNSSTAMPHPPAEQKKPAANLLVRKLLPILNWYGIPAPVDDDAWQKVPDQATNGMYGAVFTKKPWIGPHHLQVAAFANQESGNTVVSLKLCDPTGYADGSFIYLSTGESRLRDATKKLFLPMIQDLRRRFPPDERPEGLGFRREVGEDGQILATAPGSPAIDVTLDPRKPYTIKFDAIRLFGDQEVTIPESWMPPKTTIVRRKRTGRFITVHVLSLEPSPEALESNIKRLLVRVPLADRRDGHAADAIVSVQEPSARDTTDTKATTSAAGAKPPRNWDEEF